MAEAHERSKRKSSGGLYKPNTKRKKRNLMGEFSATVVDEEKKTNERKSMGTKKKISLKKAEIVNVSDSEGKAFKAEIEDVLENPANPDFVRRGIITKGSIVKTSKGRVRITSRPGQDGTLNGKLLD